MTVCRKRTVISACCVAACGRQLGSIATIKSQRQPRILHCVQDDRALGDELRYRPAVKWWPDGRLPSLDLQLHTPPRVASVFAEKAPSCCFVRCEVGAAENVVWLAGAVLGDERRRGRGGHKVRRSLPNSSIARFSSRRSRHISPAHPGVHPAVNHVGEQIDEHIRQPD
jgi:hypothetical protein